jgi:hypothetical protein
MVQFADRQAPLVEFGHDVESEASLAEPYVARAAVGEQADRA